MSEGAERIGTRVGSGSGGLSLHSSKIGPLLLDNEGVRKCLKTTRLLLTSSQIQPPRVGLLYMMHYWRGADTRTDRNHITLHIC